MPDNFGVPRERTRDLRPERPTRKLEVLELRKLLFLMLLAEEPESWEDEWQ